MILINHYKTDIIMKSLRIVAYIFMGLGILLFLTGLLFKIQHWPDMFKGFISGPVIVIIGVLTFLLTLILKKEKNNNAL
jgi:hypothetical protein